MGFSFKLIVRGENAPGNDCLEAKDHKQHLNLSEAAWLVVQQDQEDFFEKEEDGTSTGSLSGFLNIILENFYETAEASIAIRSRGMREKLEKDFGGKDFDKYDATVKNAFINKIVEVYQKEAEEKIEKLDKAKGAGKKFRINNDNVLLLKDNLSEDLYYDDSIGLYLKALYEEYCKKPHYEREKIFFKSTMDEIGLAKEAGKKLKIVQKKTNRKTGKLEMHYYYVSPYDVVHDEGRQYNYLIGLSEEVDANGDPKVDFNGNRVVPKVASLRISQIVRIRMMKSMSGFLSKADKDDIEKALVEKKPQFMVGDLEDIKVRFTKSGFENFGRQLHLRPQFCDKVEGEDLVYVFHCTEQQAKNYFFKFASDVEILEPASLRAWFKNKYIYAVNHYEMDTDGDLEDVKVKFTEEGFETFGKQRYLRPQVYEKVEGEDLVYVFHCTEQQAKNYFFKFASDVEILEPASLRKWFKNHYKYALKNYESDEE